MSEKYKHQIERLIELGIHPTFFDALEGMLKTPNQEWIGASFEGDFPRLYWIEDKGLYSFASNAEKKKWGLALHALLEPWEKVE